MTQGGKQYIQNSQRIDKSQYNQWRSNVENAAKRDHSSFLYLPTETGFVEKEGACGKGEQGYAVVLMTLLSRIIQTTLTHLLM